MPRFRHTAWRHYIAAATAVAAITQVLLEGPRWQLIPAYALTGGFLLLSLIQLLLPHVKGIRPATSPRRIFFWCSITLGVLVLLVSIALPAILPVFHFPKPTGSYQVGTLTYHWTDANRHEIFSSDPAAKRQLVAQVWYPVQGDTSSARAPYVVGAGALSSGLTHALSSGTSVRLPSFFFDHFKYVTTNAIPAAPVAKNRPSYPVLIYVSGLDGWRSLNTFQVEDLVSHGYIVVGLDQPHTAAAVALPDGTVISGLTKAQVQPLIDQSVAPAAKAPKLYGRPLADGIIPYLAQDVSFMLDQLSAIDKSDPHGILTGKLDMQHTGAFGVSLGAIVTAQACHQDQRLKACLMMDAAMPADVVQSGLRQPSMWLTRDANSMRLERKESGGWTEADISQTLGTMRTTFARSDPGSSYYVSIPGMFHVNFTDTPCWSPFTSQLGLTGPISSQRGFNVVNTYSLAFFNKALENRSPSLLDGPAKQFPEVKITLSAGSR